MTIKLYTIKNLSGQPIRFFLREYARNAAFNQFSFSDKKRYSTGVKHIPIEDLHDVNQLREWQDSE